MVRRSSAAVDRVSGGSVATHLTTCVQFAPASGLWCAAQFSNSMTYAVWAPRIQTAFRLLADSGLPIISAGTMAEAAEAVVAAAAK